MPKREFEPVATGSVGLTKPQGTTGKSTTYSSPLVDVFDQESRIIVSVQDRYQRLAKYWKCHRIEDKLKVLFGVVTGHHVSHMATYLCQKHKTVIMFS